ncbi:major facilitator superfamily domain-containing protein [Circinella umbellata]|nr:major facilitator superfamily domain-containing protein [Circinella umbellata]
MFAGSDKTIQLTLIGSLLQALLIVCVVLSNVLYERLGPRNLSILGTSLIFVGLLTTGEATKIWHFYLSLSITVGIGIALMYGMCLRCVPQWFIQKRATSFGIQGSVPSLFGLVLPFIIIQVNNTLGHKWIFRILGFIFLGAGSIAIGFMKDQPKKKNKDTLKTKRLKNFDLDVWKNRNMIIWIIVSPLAISARYVVYAFLPLCGTYLELSGTQAAATVSVMSGAEFVGRIALGILGDKIGHLNTNIISSFVCSIAILIIWMLANQFASLIGFSILCGFFGGAYTVLFPSVTSSIVSKEMYPSALNAMMGTNVLTIVLPLVASSLGTDNNSIGNDPFLLYKVVSGGIFALCGLLSCIIKFRMDRKIFAKI